MAQGLVFEIADRELDDGVLAMLGLDQHQRLGAVGRKREVLPVREQLGLLADEPGAAPDQPPIMELGLSDLRLVALWIVRERHRGCLVDQSDQRADRLALIDVDRELRAPSVKRLEQLVVLKPGVGADQNREGRAREANAGEQLIHEP